MQRIPHTPIPRLRPIVTVAAVALLSISMPAAHAQSEDEPPAQEPAGEELPQSQVPPPVPPPPLGPRREHDRHIYMTTDMRFSRAPDHTLMFEVGMNVGKAIRRNVALSVELSGSSAPLLGGNRSAFSILPGAEYFYFHGPVQAYGRLGLGTQYRGGARLDSTKALGVFAAVGSRVRLGRCRGNGPHRCGLTGCFVAGLEIRLHHATHDGWLMYPAVLPQGASILSTGFSMGYEI